MKDKTSSFDKSLRRKALEVQFRLGESVRLLRKVSGVSQASLGAVLELHQTAICRVEKGSQSLTPAELFLVGKFFGVSINRLVEGDIDFWKVAEKFNRNPPFPARYREFPFSKVRDFLPFLEFVRASSGETYTNALISRLKLNPLYLRSLDQKLSTHVVLDFLRAIISEKRLRASDMGDILRLAREPKAHGFLDLIYREQRQSIDLVQSWVLNARYYDENFIYRIVEAAPRNLLISVQASEHMQKVDFHDPVLGDFLCKYRKLFLAEFPRYIGKSPLRLTERECLYHSGSKCMYQLNLQDSA
ncbi:MAG: hypothetical protein AB1540_03675 [Bdellovibrionota bacterium]